MVISPVVGFWAWQGSRNDLALIDHAKVVQATLETVRTARGDPRTGDGGGAEGEYSYRLSDGTEGRISKTYDTVDEIPGNGNNEILEVEYLPEKPEVKRVRGTGSTSIGELRFWLGFKYFLIAIWFCVSSYFFISGVRDKH